MCFFFFHAPQASLTQGRYDRINYDRIKQLLILYGGEEPPESEIDRQAFSGAGAQIPAGTMLTAEAGAVAPSAAANAQLTQLQLIAIQQQQQQQAQLLRSKDYADSAIAAAMMGTTPAVSQQSNYKMHFPVLHSCSNPCVSGSRSNCVYFLHKPHILSMHFSAHRRFSGECRPPIWPRQHPSTRT